MTGERQSVGVPASPSGHSAGPEPSSTVSAVPVSIPNARKRRGPRMPPADHADPRWHELFWLFIHAEWSVEDIAEGFGMTPAMVREILDDELLADHEWLKARGEVA